MSLDIQIRTLQSRDAAAVAVLAFQLGYERSSDQIVDWIRQLNPASQMAYVATRNDEVVGWIEVSIVHHLQSDRHSLIGGLVVKDGTRGAGIGRLLCAQVEQWSRDQGLDTIRVTSRSTREAAHRFYLRDGYRQTKLSAVFEKALEPDPASKRGTAEAVPPQTTSNA